ncbi:response regulator [Pedobacter sp. PF22-3]|jgi:two-component system alkaline phosphatase synthesis response regulator PhoP|uniref:response regulator n=1 Tax=Pedobacter sp. PF22-3 TaxID=2994467 RepID=UPI002246ABD9|nr:response regulator [Pedobacter sp. PF22-3]MCX2494840.1 response regulator [Pedobacter sp. PF22-3]
MSNALVKKILVVDDDENIHDIIKLIFEEEHYHIKGVLDGDDLRLEETIDYFQPDLILLDIFIGKHDGRDICNKLKHNPKTASLPVILLSALNMDNLSCSPDDTIEKPFDITDLQQKVKALLDK